MGDVWSKLKGFLNDIVCKGNVIFATGKGVQTGTTATNTAVLQAYNTGSSTYKSFITLTAAATPTCAIDGDTTGTTQSQGNNSTKFATTAYVDTGLAASRTLNTAPGEHASNGSQISGTVDENTVGIFGLLHVDTDGNWVDAHADVSTTMPCIGLALESGTGAGKKILLDGIAQDASWSWTPGAELYVSAASPGAITGTAPGSGLFVQRIGIAFTATTILFRPSLDVIEVA